MNFYCQDAILVVRLSYFVVHSFSASRNHMHILEAMWITIHIGFNTGPMQDFWIQITV